MLKLLGEWWNAAYGNYIASITTLPLAFLWHHRKMKKHFKESADRHDTLLSRLEQLSGWLQDPSGDTSSGGEGN